MARPKFLRFLLDIVRFNRTTTEMAERGDVPTMSLAEFLAHEGYSQALFDWYLWPMVGSIWSSPRGEVMDFDLAMLLRFCHNHGLLQIANRPQWMTVRGGSRNYVAKVIAKLKDARLNAKVEKIIATPSFVEVRLANQLAKPERFDYAVMATHSDQSRSLLSSASPQLNEALASISYQPNRCILHTDTALMPKRRAAWASWNYLETAAIDDRRPVALTYWLNNLQPLPFTTPLFETLNPPVEPAREKVIAEFEYWHPLLNQAAIAAQSTVRAEQGGNRTYFAGAWLYNGFHEDGIRSALDCVQAINARESVQSTELAAE